MQCEHAITQDELLKYSASAPIGFIESARFVVYRRVDGVWEEWIGTIASNTITVQQVADRHVARAIYDMAKPETFLKYTRLDPVSYLELLSRRPNCDAVAKTLGYIDHTFAELYQGIVSAKDKRVPTLRFLYSILPCALVLEDLDPSFMEGVDKYLEEGKDATIEEMRVLGEYLYERVRDYVEGVDRPMERVYWEKRLPTYLVETHLETLVKVERYVDSKLKAVSWKDNPKVHLYLVGMLPQSTPACTAPLCNTDVERIGKGVIHEASK